MVEFVRQRRRNQIVSELRMNRINTLFACARNKWRSPTAEQVYRNDPRLSVRSRGLSSSSPRRLTVSDLEWAAVIFVMESSHRERIQAAMADAIGSTPIHVLDIPDEYQYMDPELVELLADRVKWYLRDI